MTDLKAEEMGEVERLAEPAGPCEGEILGKNEGGDEAPQDAAAAKQEEALPKLSAAEFMAYNSMAENMEYFVSPNQSALKLDVVLCVGEMGAVIWWKLKRDERHSTVRWLTKLGL
jgi:hypothetical protein